ncbi:MAG: hypothetical protein ACI9DC_002409 [Gammaproteobacteria bacterium]|jgi:hypothetical protein
MAFIRLYTGDDGETHIDQMELESAPSLTALHDAKRVVFRAMPPGYFNDWHVAPRRQYIITLSGAAEIGLKDGTRYRLGAGDVNLAEDLSGGGHTTRVVSDEPRVTATIHLED